MISSTVSRSGRFPRGLFQSMMAPAAAMMKNLGARKTGGSTCWSQKWLQRRRLFYDAPFFYGVHMERTMADTSSETPDATSTDTQDEIYLPPCREAEKFMTQCPRCNRTMKIKTLMYSHCCKRSFYATRRAIEQQVLANKAVDIRMASMEQRATQHAQHQTARATTQTRDYSKLLSF